MTEETTQKIFEHAEAVAPRESCGLVVIRKGKELYKQCRNIAVGTDHFHIHHEDYAEAEDTGDVTKVVHSHINVPPNPSQADLVGCETSGLPWVIVSLPTKTMFEFAPTGYKAPLIGRVFSHGVLDCYTLIRDYYQQELGITLLDFERHDNWWLTEQDLYRDNYEKTGFYVIDAKDIRKHDFLLMQISKNKTDHGAIYLGNNVILHHPMNRLSSRDAYGGFWKKITTVCLRHKDVK